MTLQEMINTAPVIGTVEWIGIRPAKKSPLQSVDSAEINIEEGLIGDHYQGRSKKRQLTLIQAEHLEVVGKILNRAPIDPHLTRRNIVISGINLKALTEQKFQIGNRVILKTTGPCAPCSRMEANLGRGGYHAMVGHGGITTQVVQGGTIKVGDQVQLIPKEQLIESD